MSPPASYAAGAPSSRCWIRAVDPQRSLDAFTGHARITDVIVVLPRDRADAPPVSASGAALSVVAGGERRQDSVANAFDAVPAAAEVVLVHDAARPFVSADLISRSIDTAAAHGAAIVAIPARETVKRVATTAEGRVVNATLPRDEIYLAQTPQAFRRDVLEAAIALGRSGVDATDEAMLAERAGHAVHIVEGDPANVKITTVEDLEWARRGLHAGAAAARIGTGYDLHRLVEGGRCCSAACRCRRARGARPFGCRRRVPCRPTRSSAPPRSATSARTFPTPIRRGRATSLDPLGRAVGPSTGRLPRREPRRRRRARAPEDRALPERIRESIAGVLQVPAGQVSVKGKTNEGMDAVGRGEAIAAHAVALLTRLP